MDDEDFIVTVSDLRSIGHCVLGIRHLARIYHLDLAAFLRDGISAQRLIETGDAIIINAVNRIKELKHGHGR